MTDGKVKALRVAARVVVLLALGLHVIIVIFAWWILSPDPSCAGLVHWGERIMCLLEESDSPAAITAGCVILWMVAGIGALLGRYLPPYISVIVPVGMVVAAIWLAHEELKSHAGPQRHFWYIFFFTTAAVLTFAGAAAGAWLWGLARRGRRRSLLRLSAVFDSAT